MTDVLFKEMEKSGHPIKVGEGNIKTEEDLVKLRDDLEISLWREIRPPYDLGETLTKEAYELIAEDNEGLAKSKIAKAAKFYEEKFDFKKAAETRVDLAKKLFDNPIIIFFKRDFFSDCLNGLVSISGSNSSSFVFL